MFEKTQKRCRRRWRLLSWKWTEILWKFSELVREICASRNSICGLIFAHSVRRFGAGHTLDHWTFLHRRPAPLLPLVNIVSSVAESNLLFERFKPHQRLSRNIFANEFPSEWNFLFKFYVVSFSSQKEHGSCVMNAVVRPFRFRASLGLCVCVCERWPHTNFKIPFSSTQIPFLVPDKRHR